MVAPMTSPALAKSPPAFPIMAWLFALLAGVVAPSIAMVVLLSAPDAEPMASTVPPILAVGLMAVGMIAAAVAGRLWIGLGLALLSGVGLLVLAMILGIPTLPNPVLIALAMGIAGFSFAARGALFGTSVGDRGWWIAVFVVAGEAAIVATAAAEPGMLPDWLLVLLPAQWASMAIAAALTGTFSGASVAALIALGGTAAATLLVRTLFPSRWPYIVMFTTWLALSALVHHQLAP